MNTTDAADRGFQPSRFSLPGKLFRLVLTPWLVLATRMAFLAASNAAELDVTQVARWPEEPRGSAVGVAFFENRAYLALGKAGVSIVDLTDTSHPRRLGGLVTGGTAINVKAGTNLVYVADGGAGLQILDVARTWESTSENQCPQPACSAPMARSISVQTTECFISSPFRIRHDSSAYGRRRIHPFGPNRGHDCWHGAEALSRRG